MKFPYIAFIIPALFAPNLADAVPWCHKGTIVQVANITLSGSTLSSMSAGLTVPMGVSNPDYYKAYTVGANMCTTYSGGGGYGNVPGKGTVRFVAYSPYSFTNGFDFNISQGLSFKCDKCYAIPPLMEIHMMKRKRVKFKPLEGISGVEKYMLNMRKMRKQKGK